MVTYIIEVFKSVDNQVKMLGANEMGCTCCLAIVREETGKHKNANEKYKGKNK